MAGGAAPRAAAAALLGLSAALLQSCGLDTRPRRLESLHPGRSVPGRKFVPHHIGLSTDCDYYEMGCEGPWTYQEWDLHASVGVKMILTLKTKSYNAGRELAATWINATAGKEFAVAGREVSPGRYEAEASMSLAEARGAVRQLDEALLKTFAKIQVSLQASLKRLTDKVAEVNISDPALLQYFKRVVASKLHKRRDVAIFGTRVGYTLACESPWATLRDLGASMSVKMTLETESSALAATWNATLGGEFAGLGRALTAGRYEAVASANFTGARAAVGSLDRALRRCLERMEEDAAAEVGGLMELRGSDAHAARRRAAPHLLAGISGAR
mmetsp:Transcript_72597/g.222321  ORF Transcript_72597/g.222321 Transcript_72597/m.222321 type:complete len:329 (-) Transcript_72597:72-1058(-)